MSEEAAVLDAPVADAAAAPEITPVDTGSDVSIDTADDSEGQGEQPVDPAAQPELEEAEGLVVDGKRLSAKALQFLQETKAKDPKLAGQLRAALFDSDQLRRLHPGGIKEATQLHQRFQELGGEDGLKEMSGKLDFFQGIDADFTAGNPRFVEALAEADPVAFAKIAPAVIAKYESMHPEALSSFVSGKMLSEMSGKGFELALMRLADFIDVEKPNAVTSYNSLVNFVNGLHENASKKVEAPGKQAPGAEKGDEFKSREENIIRSEWRVEQDQFRRTSFSGEYGKLANGRKINSDNEVAIKELCVGRIAKALEGNKEFNSKLQRYFEARDKEGFLKFFNSQYKTTMSAEMRRSFDQILGTKRGPVAAALNGAGKAAPVAVPGAPDKGFAWIPNQPSAGDVDMRHPANTRDTWAGGKAILKDGRKVQWRNK